MRSSLAGFAGTALALCLLSSVTLADTLKFTATLDPEKDGGPGKGTATLSLDTQTKALTGTIEYSGLSAPPVMAAFLAPPPKQNGNPVTMPIPLTGGAASPINVKMQLNDAQIGGLKSGDWLLLLGTKQAPQIGGEVKPAQ
ncbi:MAG: CHRD domain-containing protein [Alphaproteobacteria bacterium]|nr:CHRD domain-containing protein [Alphaproteobacteria bacterium]